MVDELRSEAQAVLTKAIEIDPAYALSRFNMGLLLAAQNKLDDAIAQVNDSRYGLQAGIFTQDISKALSVSSRVICLQEGRVSLRGRSSEVSREQISRAYFGI